MSSGRWSNDKYYKKAKTEGYRSRAAYKLKQLDEKFHIFTVNRKPAKKILDLGCHPGSFIQYLLNKYDKMNQEGNDFKLYILGIDRTSIKPFDRSEVEFYRGDIFKSDVEELISQRGKFDIILSDLAPNTAGDYRDAAIQEFMVKRVYELLKYLRFGGNVVIKIFESPETQGLIKLFKRKFRVVKLTKPNASRSKSREKFLIAKEFM